jgi:hypothetical protein
MVVIVDSRGGHRLALRRIYKGPSRTTTIADCRVLNAAVVGLLANVLWCYLRSLKDAYKRFSALLRDPSRRELWFAVAPRSNRWCGSPEVKSHKLSFSPLSRSSHIQRVEYRQACQTTIDPASNLNGKPYKLIQYGFNPAIRDRCRDRRRNPKSPASYLVRRVDPFRDCQRRFFHDKRAR